jgi:hypothetical protein
MSRKEGGQALMVSSIRATGLATRDFSFIGLIPQLRRFSALLLTSFSR